MCENFCAVILGPRASLEAEINKLRLVKGNDGKNQGPWVVDDYITHSVTSHYRVLLKKIPYCHSELGLPFYFAFQSNKRKIILLLLFIYYFLIIIPNE